MKSLIIVLFILAPAFAFSQISDLVYYWAPLHIQKISKRGKNALNGKSDQISAINFDNDWDASNNWENIETYDITPSVYFSLVESDHYYFILFAFFHARDYSKIRIIGIGEHENDLEGALFIIEKDNSKYGKLIGSITIFHNQLLKYPYSRITIDAFTKKPITFQQAGGHGLKIASQNKTKLTNSILYKPTAGEISYLINDNKYVLINIFEPNGLWEQRTNPSTFDTEGNFLGDNGNGAKPPWKWDNKHDSNANRYGEIATDPLKLAKDYFNLNYPNDSIYIKNMYQFK